MFLADDFEREAQKFVGLPKDVLNTFIEAASDLAPENVHMDGECTLAEANARYKRAVGNWTKLAKRFGIDVHADYAEAVYQVR